LLVPVWSGRRHPFARRLRWRRQVRCDGVQTIVGHMVRQQDDRRPEHRRVRSFNRSSGTERLRQTIKYPHSGPGLKPDTDDILNNKTRLFEIKEGGFCYKSEINSLTKLSFQEYGSRRAFFWKIGLYLALK